MLGSCSSENEPINPDSGDGYKGSCDLVVSLVADTPIEKRDISTRAGETWGDPYDSSDANTFENAIDNVFMYVVTSDNHIFPLITKFLNAENGVKEYKITLSLDNEYVTPASNGKYIFSGRIVALANMKGAMPASPFEYLEFKSADIDNDEYIPMWGVTSYVNVELKPEETVDGGEIVLLRSVPKLTFELADNISDKYRITSVSSPRNDFRLEGNCNPTGCESAYRTKALSIEGCFNESADGLQGPSPKVRYNSGSTKTTIYLPEMICQKDNSGMPPYFDVTLERADGSSLPIKGKVYLCDYTSGKPVMSSAFPRLVRNHDYQFIIDLAELEFTISFREWIFGGKVHIDLE